MPDFFPKYAAQLVERETISQDCRIYYHDLDGDERSEKIVTNKNYRNRASFKVYDPDGALIDQWNFDGKYPSTNHILWFSDANKNGFSEVSFITTRRDSIFLNNLEPLHARKSKTVEVLVDTLSSHKDKTLYVCNEMIVDDEAESIRLYFSLHSGFSAYPRNLYRIDLKTHEVEKSHYLANKDMAEQLVDLDGDGSHEIILSGHSSGNQSLFSPFGLSDSEYWIKVLNSDFTFHFPPVKLDSKFSSTKMRALKKDGSFQILCLINSKRTEELACQLQWLSSRGEELMHRVLPAGKYEMFPNPEKETITLIDKSEGTVKVLDYDFGIAKEISLETKGSMVFKQDLDDDDKEEWIVASRDNRVSFYRHNFENEVKLKLPGKETGRIYCGVVSDVQTQPLIYFQRGGHFYLYAYSENEKYYLQYAAMPGIFILSWLLVLVIARGQRYQQKKKQEIEQQISELQIKALTNKVEPHFLFNAMNTISSMVLSEEKEEADQFISRYSKFMRQTLKSSDRIAYPLKNEIRYVENYILLQKARFTDSFEYEFDIGKNVNLEKIVPKHVLYCYIENAFKHGLSGRKNGFLKIEIRSVSNTLILTIENTADTKRENFSSAKIREQSTGSGLKIMERVYELYAKIYKGTITHSMIPLESTKDRSGLRVEIEIGK